MTTAPRTTAPTSNVPGRPARKPRWGRRILIGLAALVVLVVAGGALYVALDPVPAPLALPTSPASGPVGPVEGTWYVAAGSQAGFRIRQTVMFASNDVVQRTTAVSGTLVVSGNRIATATFRVDLTNLANTDDGQTTPQVALSLDTQRHPDSTFTLTKPLILEPAAITGTAINARAVGQLTLRGVSRPVSFTISGRRDGDTLQVSGAIPVSFADWEIPNPAGYGPLGSLADHGIAEFLVILRHH